jgi:hypothetical protein
LATAKRESPCIAARQLPCEYAIFSLKGSNRFEIDSLCCPNVTEKAPRLRYTFL